jgi:hypothetical protein
MAKSPSQKNGKKVKTAIKEATGSSKKKEKTEKERK